MAKKKAKQQAKHAAVKISADNPYKKGSRKAEIYEVFKRDGLDGAMAHAVGLDIKPGTVKSWSSMWLKGTVKPATKEKADKPKPEQVAGFHPVFKYTSRSAADKGHEMLCTSSGLRAHAFHVIEDDGRFAVVPAHYKPGGPVPQFKAGDIVYDAFIANTKAKVIEAGPEQTLIRYVKERPKGPREECVINRYLVKLPDEAPTKKTLKRERARL